VLLASDIATNGQAVSLTILSALLEGRDGGREKMVFILKARRDAMVDFGVAAQKGRDSNHHPRRYLLLKRACLTLLQMRSTPSFGTELTGRAKSRLPS